MRTSKHKHHFMLGYYTFGTQNTSHISNPIKLQLDTPTFIGFILLTLFFVQYAFDLSPRWLLSLQNSDVYKQITGFVLFTYVYYQWHLAFIHLNKQQPTQAQRNTHRIYGAIAPLVYFIHSTELGYAYQSLLSSAFLGNCLIGSINPQVVRIKSRQYYSIWILSHIGLAVLVVVLLFYHLYVTYTY